jgi:hypothetical protein
MNELTTVLTTARKILVINGWVRGVYAGSCGYCAVGAIRAAGADFDTEVLAVEALFGQLPAADKIAAGPFTAMFEWNDNVAADVGDVLALFDCAIERSKETV